MRADRIRNRISAWIAILASGTCLLIGCAAPDAPAAQPAPVAYDPTLSAGGNCNVGRSVDFTVYRSTVDIVERSGDLEQARNHFSRVRMDVEHLLVALDPDALSKADAVLEAAFSASTMRKQAACDFTRYARTPTMIAAWQAWETDALLHDVHRRVVADPDATPTADAQVDDARRALLDRVWAATGKVDYTLLRQQLRRNGVARLQRALDPLAPAGSVAEEFATSTTSAQQRAARNRLATRLAGVSDGDIARFLGWAESGPGRAYYRSLLASYTSAHALWFDALLAEIRTRVVPSIVVIDDDRLRAALDDVRAGIERIETPYDQYPLKQRLDALSLHTRGRDKLDAARLALSARLEVESLVPPQAMASRPPRERHLLRDSDLAADSRYATNFVRADAALEQALSASPGDAELLALAGYVDFLKMRDADAAKRFDDAQRIAPHDPQVALYQGDLAYAQGRSRQAEAFYRTALAAPGEQRLTRFRALTHLALALEAQGRATAFDADAATQLQAEPKDFRFRAAYAEMLLDRDASAERVAAVVAAIPASWHGDDMTQLRDRIEVQRMIDAPVARRGLVMDAALARFYDSQGLAMGACRSRDPAIVHEILRAKSQRVSVDDLTTTFLGCALLYGRHDALKLAIPLAKDIDAPVNALWQNTPLCGAAERFDARAIAMLLEAGADPERACSDQRTPRELLASSAAQGIAAAVDALQTFDATQRGHRTDGR